MSDTTEVRELMRLANYVVLALKRELSSVRTEHTDSDPLSCSSAFTVLDRADFDDPRIYAPRIASVLASYLMHGRGVLHFATPLERFDSAIAQDPESGISIRVTQDRATVFYHRGNP